MDRMKAGRNVIGVRVSASLSRFAAAESSDGPLFLYSPKAEASPAK
jgi:hypothetical protein